MAGLDRRLDPITGDYVDDGAGGYEDTDTVETAGFHQVRTEKDRYWADPDAGSYLHVVQQMTLSGATVQFAEDTLRAAFQRLIRAGLAREQLIEAAVDPLVAERLLLRVLLVDRHAGAIDLTEVAGV